MAERKAKIWAIVPAAGSGQRMGEDIPKQYLMLHGKTVIEHSVGLLSNCERIDQVVICTAVGDDRWPQLNLDATQIHGGSSRAKSVSNGLSALIDLADSDDWVLVHDAARPCLSPQALVNFIDQLEDHAVGGILAMPAKDTLKQAYGGRAEIEITLDRTNIWQAQTPQMFRYELLKQALTSALADDAEVTDESSAVERAGYQPALVEGDAKNLKITTPEDLALAEFLLRS